MLLTIINIGDRERARKGMEEEEKGSARFTGFREI